MAKDFWWMSGHYAFYLIHEKSIEIKKYFVDGYRLFLLSFVEQVNDPAFFSLLQFCCM